MKRFSNFGFSASFAESSNVVESSMSSLSKSVVESSISSLHSVSKSVTAVSGAISSMTMTDEKKKCDAILALLEDVRLQAPRTHAGIVVAFTATNMSPVNNPGVKFRWYKMIGAGADQFREVDESSRAWYAPTADDIGGKICVQCEDKFQQGFSRYLESSVLEADPLLCTIVESAIEKGAFEAKDCVASVGTTEKGFDGQTNIDASLRPTLLLTTDKDNHPFIQLSGRSTIEIDQDSFFISLPIPTSQDDEGHFHYSNSINNNKHTNNKSVRRGLQMSISDGISVICGQPASLILTVPLARETILNPTESDSTTSVLTPYVPKFVTPWTYVRLLNNNSNSSILSKDGQSTSEEELEVTSFSSILMSLEQFMSSLPAITTELKFCISCENRMQRDALCCLFRVYTNKNLTNDTQTRISALPWHSTCVKAEDTKRTISDLHIAQLTKKISELEQENGELMKEKEKYSNLFLVKEEKDRLRGDRMRKPSMGEDGPETVQQLVEGGGGLVEDGAAMREIDREGGTSDALNDKEVTRMLSSKVMELENKVAVWTKREAEASKGRQEATLKATTLQRELDTARRRVVELDAALLETAERLVTQTELALALDAELVRVTQLLNAAVIELQELEALRSSDVNKSQELAELRASAGSLEDELIALRPLAAALRDELAHCRAVSERQHSEADAQLNSLRQELKTLTSDYAACSAQVEALSSDRELLKETQAALEKITAENADNASRADSLHGEINSLHRKAESQGRDLKRVLNDSAVVVQEFEKALIRKSGDCDELHMEIEKLKNQLKNAQNPVVEQDGESFKLSGSRRFSFLNR